MPTLPHFLHELRQRSITLAYRSETGTRRQLSRLAGKSGWKPALLPYAGYASSHQARILGRVVLAPASADPAARRGIPAWMRLLTLEVPGQKVEIEFEGETVTAVSNDGGVIDAQVPLSSTPQAGMATALLRIPGRAPAKATIHVVDPAASRGVICDIDDTIWVTGLAHPLKAARRTLLSTSSSRRSVPGMAALLNEAVRDQDHPAVLYLSNGPWNLAGLASRFLRRDDFPAGPTLMTDWGITPRRWFRDGKEHKRSSIARLHKDFPHITWVLIGDDGEHDPQIYLDFARDHRDNVEVIVLREVDPTANRKPDPVTTTDGVPVLRGPDGNALLPLLRRSRQD